MQNRIVEGFRLSPQQKQLWLMPGDGSVFRAECILQMEGNLDEDALKKTIEIIVNRHEILRTSYERLPGMKTPVQVVAESARPEWQKVDVSKLERNEQESKIEEVMRKERRHPFNFEQNPLLRLLLLKVSSNKHLLYITLPSLCADAWTLKNLVQEIGSTYAAHAGGDNAAATSDEPMQYADFSEWQNELLNAEDENGEAGQAYWGKQQQQDVSVQTSLAFAFERKASSGGNDADAIFEAAQVSLKINPRVIAKIETLADERETSTSAFLLACWQTLIARLSGGTSSVTIATLFDGRKYEDLYSSFGLFARWLPLSSNFEADLRFSEILQKVDASVRESNEWQEYFSPEGNGGQSSFPIAFEFVEQASQRRAADVSFSILRQSSYINPFKIKLTCVRADESLDAELHYNSNLFQEENIRRILSCFETLLESAASNPEARASELEILSEAERHQLLSNFNRTTADYPQDKCLHEMFEEQVERTPNAVAVAFEDQQLTYAELNSRANRLAHGLRKRGVGADVRVGLCVERSLEMLVGMVGILKAGGAYVPLNPEHPKARLQQQLADTGSPVLITQAKLLDQLPEFAGDVICLDRDATTTLLHDEPTTNPERITTPENLVYVIYTSGSTGVPKGVAISHRNLVNYTHFICGELQVEEASANGGLHFATVSTIGADLGNTCIFPSLVSGGCLHVIGYEAAMDGGMFADYVARHPIDVLKIVPSHMSALLASAASESILPGKFLIFGGEPLSPNLINRVSELSKECQIINHYGPTETTIGSLTYSLREKSDDAALSSTIPIGRPIANTSIYILDQHLKPVAIGTPGQLYIGGLGVSKGYLNQPEQTAERFIPDLFASAVGDESRLYNTGDLARYLPTGNVEFLGRRDHQVKIRGFRIELGEIEAVLKGHNLVSETIVTARGGAAAGGDSDANSDSGGSREPGQESLVAYVVLHKADASNKRNGESGTAPTVLRGYLKEMLPEYMLPTHFVIIDALPLTPNGKIDRRKLPAPEDVRQTSHAVHVAPRNEVEQIIAQIWQEALHLDKVGVDDNFFDLGGHSLLMVKVHSKLRGAVGGELSIIDMFKYTTISSLANYLSQGRGEQPSVEINTTTTSSSNDRGENRRDAAKRQREARQGHRQQSS